MFDTSNIISFIIVSVWLISYGFLLYTLEDVRDMINQSKFTKHVDL